MRMIEVLQEWVVGSGRKKKICFLGIFFSYNCMFGGIIFKGYQIPNMDMIYFQKYHTHSGISFLFILFPEMRSYTLKQMRPEYQFPSLYSFHACIF